MSHKRYKLLCNKLTCVCPQLQNDVAVYVDNVAVLLFV